jgi:PTS system nitrogen regulatory IIA component
MEIHDILASDSVLTSVRATSKKQALQELAKHASRVTGLHDRTIFDVLLERERLGTTGVGRGIAIPHGKLSELDRLYGIFAVLEQPIEFDSVDDQPVDLIFLLLAPESAGADHLKALARVSRLLRDSSFCDRLRAAANPNELFEALTRGKATHAA